MRAFIALDVPEGIKERAELLEAQFSMEGLTLVKKDAMHITMQFLGEINAEQAEKTIEAMKRISFRPFRVSLSGVSYFTPRLIRVIFVEIAQGEKELISLYGKLSKELATSGVDFEQENYKPHLTIARVKRVREMQRLREALERNSKAELGSFDVRSIAFKESTLTPNGPVYNDLYELKL
jgi:2'-5' RNA ligase